MKFRTVCLFLAASLTAFGTGCDRRAPGTYRETDGITLDANVPGTKVFLADRQLGTVPVTLSAKTLASLGILNPRKDSRLLFNTDGFKETVYVTGSDNELKYFTFQVPERVRAGYVPMETPWGIRTKHSGGSFQPGIFVRVKCDPLVRNDGLSLTLDALQKVSNGKSPWKVQITLVNHGAQAVSGTRPSIKICQSIVTPRWSTPGRREVALPGEWATISLGQPMKTELSIDPPDVEGDYGIFVIFSLFKDETSNYLAGEGWCYSNTKLFQVKH